MFEMLEKLNPEQYEAATTIEGPLLILAGAGSGKTFCLTCRAGNMIHQGISPENILMLTFTNKAAREMKDRIGRFLGEDVANRLTASTFHSFCVMMLRKFHKVANLDPNFTVLSSGDDEDIISMVKSSEDKQRYSGRGFPSNGKVCSFISASINKNISIAQAMKDTKYEHFYAEVEELKEKADEYKRLNQCLNYDDLLVRFIEVLQHKPTAQRIAATYQYIMVDEYQDTNPLQDKILLALFEFTKNIAVVGDDLQSLYGFRGADVQNIIRFPEKFMGCKTITLVRNYRSCQEVLDLSNKITLCATEGTPKQLIGTYHSGNKPVVLSVTDQHDEADRVLQIIRKCESSGIPLEDICIVERNSISSAEIEVKLNKEGYEFDKYGGSKFVDLSYVKDILAYLKLMSNPYDEISWFRILQLHAGIGSVNARKIADGCKKDGFKHLTDKKYARRQYGEELDGLYKQLLSCEKLKLTELITSFIDFYVATSRRNIENMKTDEANRTLYNLELDAHADDLKKLIDIAAPYRSIDSFLDDLLLDNTKVDEIEDNKGHVVISTIHSVKGLEYDTVIMLDCLDEIFPKYDEVGDTQYNEELRCFYVAVTRAKTKLFIMCPKSANRFGQPIAGIPSHYLKETSGLLASNDKYFFDRFVEKDALDDYFGGYNRYRRFW